jgi:hypothetical protein
MIADSYLQVRDELEAAVRSLLKLAGEMRRTAPWLDMLQSFVAEIRQPLLLVVVGESKSGKSSLLNALFGAEFVCERELRRICVFQYGRESKSVDLTPTLREWYLPAAFLRDLKIVDPPGFEKLAAEDRQTLLEFVTRADVVLLVFSLRHPWTQASWEFVTGEQLPLKKLVFVLQQADLREPKEIAIIRHNLEDDAKQKLGFTPPIFAISARDAVVARSSRSANQRPQQQSEFDGLKEQINLVVTQSGGRTQELRSACQLGQVVLHDMASELHACVDAAAHDERRLARTEALRQMLKEQTLRHLNDALVRLDGICREQIGEAVELIARKLSPAKMSTLLSRSTAWLERCEADFETKVGPRIEEHLEETAQVLETELRGLWPQLHDTIDQQLVTEAKEKVPQAGPDFAQQKQDLLEATARAVSQHLTGNPSQIEQSLARVSVWLRACLVIAGLSAALALVTTKFGSGIGSVLALLAICTGFAGAAGAWTARQAILRGYTAAKHAQMDRLRQIVAGELNHAVDTFHDAVVEKLQPLIEHCQAQRRGSEPLLRRAEELQRTLVGLSSRLR